MISLHEAKLPLIIINQAIAQPIYFPLGEFEMRLYQGIIGNPAQFPAKTQAPASPGFRRKGIRRKRMRFAG